MPEKIVSNRDKPKFSYDAYVNVRYREKAIWRSVFFESL